MDHLQCAEECLKLAQRTNDPQYKKRLEGIAQELETMAAERAEQLAKVRYIRSGRRE
jgi:hypothetical protein